MTWLPDSWDVLLQILKWIGIPALFLLPLNLVLWALGWIYTARKAKEVSHAAASAVHSFVNDLSGRRLPNLVVFILAQALFLASTLSTFKLVEAMTVPDHTGLDIASGRTFHWEELWRNLTTYVNTSEETLKAFWFAAGWLLVFHLAHLLKSKTMITIAIAPASLLIPLSLLAAAGIGFIGVLVFLLATVFDDPQYNLEMVSLYALWVLFLGSFAGALTTVVNKGETCYDFPSKG
ncbi:MAG: hypothetical protein GX483_02455 [Actinomycetaceae bacterium]|nr:hypothetical protein [Actinomycetaceae bacterium]